MLQSSYILIYFRFRFGLLFNRFTTREEEHETPKGAARSTEIHRDALYVSENYAAGYGEAEGAARRPRTKTEVIGAWRGLAREAPQGGGRLVGVLPWRTSDISCQDCGLSVGTFSCNCVRAEPKHGIR